MITARILSTSSFVGLFPRIVSEVSNMDENPVHMMKRETTIPHAASRFTFHSVDIIDVTIVIDDISASLRLSFEAALSARL